MQHATSPSLPSTPPSSPPCSSATPTAPTFPLRSDHDRPPQPTSTRHASPDEAFTQLLRQTFTTNPTVPEIYTYALHAWRSGSMPLSSLLRTVEVLFAAHPELLRGFHATVLRGESQKSMARKQDDPAELLDAVARIYREWEMEDEFGFGLGFGYGVERSRTQSLAMVLD